MVHVLRNVRLSTVMIAPAVITLLFLPLTSAFAQVQEAGEEEVTLLRYINPTWGVFMQYPSNWAASTSALRDYTELIAFYSPLQSLSQPFTARLAISGVQLIENVSLPEYTQLALAGVNESGLDVKDSSEVTVAGYPGFRVVLADTPFQNDTLLTVYTMKMWTSVGNRLYLLTYDGEASTFNQHLPEVSRILESLRIASNNMTSTAADREGAAGNQTQQQSFANQTDGEPLDNIGEQIGELFGGGGQQ